MSAKGLRNDHNPMTVWIKNPDLDNAENWEEWHEEFISWEEIFKGYKFFNETEKNLTFSKDTADDPQYYSFYRPKEGIPNWIKVPVEVKVVSTVHPPVMGMVQRKPKVKGAVS